MVFTGMARDVVTPLDCPEPVVRAEDRFDAVIDSERNIVAIETFPERQAAAQLVGCRGGGQLRKAIAAIMPDEQRRGTPLHLLLDDIAGASLVATWAWSQWTDDWLQDREGGLDKEKFATIMERMTGICVGYAEGSTAHRLGMNRGPSEGVSTGDLCNPQDPEGWHCYGRQTGVGMRRARRIDVVRRDGWIEVESAFQDSGSKPDGGRQALHEYTISAVVDAATCRIVAIDAQPRVLPFPECPAATRTLGRLEGAFVADLRTIVLERLRGTAGCTHLNDALRALAEVPRLIAMLDGP